MRLLIRTLKHMAQTVEQIVQCAYHSKHSESARSNLKIEQMPDPVSVPLSEIFDTQHRSQGVDPVIVSNINAKNGPRN